MKDQSCVRILTEWDIVAARQLGRNVAKELDLEQLTKQELRRPFQN